MMVLAVDPFKPVGDLSRRNRGSTWAGSKRVAARGGKRDLEDPDTRMAFKV